MTGEEEKGLSEAMQHGDKGSTHMANHGEGRRFSLPQGEYHERVSHAQSERPPIFPKYVEEKRMKGDVGRTKKASCISLALTPWLVMNFTPSPLPFA